MKRLLRVSLDILVTSIVPIAQYFLIGMLLDSNLINVFSLTYPLQFVVVLLKSMFGTGPNILACKEKDKNAIDCGIVFGVVVGAVIFGTIAYRIENYIKFMKMEVSIYRVFGIYSVFQIYLQFVLQLILTKLYYREENKKANRIAIDFNVINFVSIIGLAFLAKSQEITVSVSLVILFIYIALILITNIQKFEFQFHLLKCIKYDSVDFFNGITFILIYLFGLKNVFSFGEKYILATTFATLVTDMQWDIIRSIIIVEKVDIAKKNFVYQKHMKNAYLLDGILIISIFFMSFALYHQYNPELKISMLLIGAELIMLLMYPIYMTRTCYLQLEYSGIKVTVHKEIANLIRMLLSASLVTPYCTAISQLVSMIYQLFYTKIMWVSKDHNLKKMQNRKVEYN